MRSSDVFSNLFTFFLPPAIICTIGLYLHPILFDCTFPIAEPPVAGCMIPGQQRDSIPAVKAPFRLLTLADPQLEGDTSLPNPDDPWFPSIGKLWDEVRDDGITTLPSSLAKASKNVFTEDVIEILQGIRKRIDLWGNDLYLAHIYRGVSWWSDPTHMVVLGDLLGSQHISDEEFKRRSGRFWSTVFSGTQKVPRSVTDVSGGPEILGKDKSWKKRLIAVAGNHDIGYAGDITEHRIQRFEDTYGSVNWQVRFRLENETSTAPSTSGWGSMFGLPQLQPTVPELRLVILNSMNLDSPAKNTDLQDQSREFASQELHESPYASGDLTATVLLTHIPLYKEEGICADGPFFDWIPSHEGAGIAEQNHLSDITSTHLLNGLAKSAKAIVLNGHDHEGCAVYHHRISNSSEPQWKAGRYHPMAPEVNDEDIKGVREITVRSMMGSYWGNAGFLSGWFDNDDQQWHFEYNSCSLGVQHIWWGVHIFDILVIWLGIMTVFTSLWEDMKDKTAAIVEQERSKYKSE